MVFLRTFKILLYRNRIKKKNGEDKLKLKFKVGDDVWFDLSPDEHTYAWFISFTPSLIFLQVATCSVERYVKCFGKINSGNYENKT